MHFDSLSSFLAMGGYAIYVWPTFIMTWVCFVVLVVHSKWQKSVLLRQVLNEFERKKRIEAERELKKELNGESINEPKT